jgi:hypothetical protein
MLAIARHAAANWHIPRDQDAQLMLANSFFDGAAIVERLRQCCRLRMAALCSPSSKFLVVQRLLVEYTREGASRGRGRQRPAKRPTRAAHRRAVKFKRRRGGSSSVDSRSRSRGWGHRPRGQARSRSRCARRSPAALACTSRSRTSASIAASRSCAACACRSRSRLSSSIVASRFCAAPA